MFEAAHSLIGEGKSLTAARYKHPGLHWWPSHTRGLESLGEVIKDYAVKEA